jgi:excisionase family DNA binding protein
MTKGLAMPRELLMLAQGASEIGCSVDTLRRYISQGRISAIRVGPKGVRIERAELDAFLSRRIPTATRKAV